MCSTKESNELFSGQDVSKARMLESEESRKTRLEVSGRGEMKKKKKHLQGKLKRSERRV